MDIETIKYIAAVIMVATFWVLCIAPAIVAGLFGYSLVKYKDSVKAGICMTAVISGVIAFVCLFVFCVETLTSGVPW